jgi:hypothetical protein
MAHYNVSASALIPANLETVYALIADYKNGHTRIIPKPYFLSLNVEKGGYGEGTIIDFQMKLMGQIQSFHSVITEPTPGRILVETDQNTGAATTFSLEPRKDGKQSFVTITTALPVADGITGQIRGWFIARLLRPVYVQELQQLAVVATEEASAVGT